MGSKLLSLQKKKKYVQDTLDLYISIPAYQALVKLK